MSEFAKVTRSESLESIPSVDFLADELNDSTLLSDAITMTDFRKKEMNGELLPEPMLMEDKTRFVLFPIKQHDVRRWSHNGQ
jgi:hypothetical protein